jgi:hypothetical protein
MGLGDRLEEARRRFTEDPDGFKRKAEESFEQMAAEFRAGRLSGDALRLYLRLARLRAASLSIASA